MLYAQIPLHLVVKTKEELRNEPVERSKEPLPMDNSVRYANKQMDALLDLEEHYRRQTELDLEAHYCRQSAQMLLEAQRHPRAESSRWGTNITDVRLPW